MYSNFADDLAWSTKLFIEQVWPSCRSGCGGGDLIQIEGHADDELKKLLDTMSGIDGLQVFSDGLRGIASRIQIPNAKIKTKFPYDSFTIRLARDNGAVTEFKKRKSAIKSGGKFIYPWIAIQAYAKTKTGPILSIGMAKTVDIFKFIDLGHATTNRTTNATFYVCYWGHMIEKGFKVKIWRPKINENSS